MGRVGERSAGDEKFGPVLGYFSERALLHPEKYRAIERIAAGDKCVTVHFSLVFGNREEYCCLFEIFFIYVMNTYFTVLVCIISRQRAITTYQISMVSL